MADDVYDFMEPERFDVVISYAHRDEREYGCAAELAAALKAEGISVWYDKELMNDAGIDWHTAILGQLTGCLVVAALWSKTALSRPFCDFEGKHAAEKPDMLMPFELEPLQDDWFSKELYGLSYRHTRVPYDRNEAAKQIKARVEKLRSRSEAAEKAKRLAPAAPTAALLAQARIDLPAVLTSGSGFLAGREAEETLLLDAWKSCSPGADPKDKTNIVVLHAIGGAGKTALLRRLVDRLAAEEFPKADKVLGWSAYSQGSGENRNADSDSFMIDSLRFMGEMGELPKDAVARARLLSGRLQKTRTLLLLDGIEPLQSTPDVDRGRLKDKGLQRLIQDLAMGHPGLIVITSRQHLPELETRAAPAVRSHELDRLSPRAGAHLLRHLGCRGSARDLEKAVEEVQGHALSTTLLGTYIKAVEGGDIARRDHLGLAAIIDTPEELQATNQTARLAKRAAAIMHGYVQRFEALESQGQGQAERLLLSIVGLFDRPADGPAVTALLEGEAIPGLTDAYAAWPAHQRSTRLAAAKTRLRELKLLLAQDDADPHGLDAHPVVRVHFGGALQQANPEAHQAAHERLYRHYAAAAPDLPETLAEMQPLFTAIGHGCAARLFQETWDDIYIRRICRGGDFFVLAQLGAFAAYLGALAHFFDSPWSLARKGLGERIRAAIPSYAAFALRALGRLSEAEGPMTAGLAMSVETAHWDNAARAAGNLSDIQLLLGRVGEAVMTGEQGVVYADRSQSGFQAIVIRAAHANALSHAGLVEAAAVLLTDAEARQRQRQPQLPRLYSLQGYYYLEHLLEQGAAHEVLDRVLKDLPGMQALRWLQDIGVYNLAAARSLSLMAAHGDSAAAKLAATSHDEATTALRIAGADEFLTQGLLARAKFRRHLLTRDADLHQLPAIMEDLAEIEDIASRGGMKLYLTDWHLESACVRLAQIQGAPAEELIPLRMKAENDDKIGWRIVSTGPAPPPIRTTPLNADERRLLASAEEHTKAAYDLVQETGYHRRDRELTDLRRRLDVLRALS